MSEMSVVLLLQAGPIDWLDLASRFGLPITLLLIALVTGAMGKWYFAKSVDERIVEIKATYEARLADKDKEIVMWRSAYEIDAKTSQASLLALQKQADALIRIEELVRKRGARQ